MAQPKTVTALGHCICCNSEFDFIKTLAHCPRSNCPSHDLKGLDAVCYEQAAYYGMTLARYEAMSAKRADLQETAELEGFDD
jgi:hypothetical protein